MALGKVYLFTPEKEYRDRLPAAMRRPAAVGRTVLERFGDPSAPGAIEAYFNELFTAEGEGLDSKHIVARMEEGFLNGLSFPFETVASEFNLIEENTRKVVIPKYLDQSVLARLRAGERSRDLQRKIQQAAVNVYPGHYTQLHGRGALEVLDSELAILTDETQYSDATGLNTFFKSGIGIFI